MDVSISLPLDDGFLRRECPTCGRQFKWWSHDADGQPAEAEPAPFYFCPYCGVQSDPDSWWTQEQLDFAEASMAGPVTRMIADELEGVARRSSSGFISFSVHREAEQDPPDPLFEPDDMIIVEPPCHPIEPLKVDEEWSEALHCLACGASFSV